MCLERLQHINHKSRRYKDVPLIHLCVSVAQHIQRAHTHTHQSGAVAASVSLDHLTYASRQSPQSDRLKSRVVSSWSVRERTRFLQWPSGTSKVVSTYLASARRKKKRRSLQQSINNTVERTVNKTSAGRYKTKKRAQGATRQRKERRALQD
jgi:hypothetical protein